MTVLGTNYHDLLNQFAGDIRSKISKKLEKERNRALYNLNIKHLSTGEGITECRLAEVYKALVSNGINVESVAHTVNNFSDNLLVTINGTEFNLSLPLFPKGNDDREINISIKEYNIKTGISPKTLPDSIVNLLTAISEWIPEYVAITQNIIAEEEKKELACRIGFDALRRNAEGVLKRKGYDCSIKYHCSSYSATIKIHCGKSVLMDIEVKLLEDFMERITAIIDSLPIASN